MDKPKLKSSDNPAGVTLPAWVTESESIDNDFWLWHDNLQPFELFMQCKTQWRYSFGGIAGLDYAAVLAVIALQVKKRSKQYELLECIQALEQGALMAWADKAAIDRSNEKDSKFKLSAAELAEIEVRRAWRC